MRYLFRRIIASGASRMSLSITRAEMRDIPGLPARPRRDEKLIAAAIAKHNAKAGQSYLTRLEARNETERGDVKTRSSLLSEE